jgi:hypothetical protein
LHECLLIADLCGRRLTHCFYDTDAIATYVTDHRGHEANSSGADELSGAAARRILWEVLVYGVVCEKPGVVTDQRGCRSRECAVEHYARSAGANLVGENASARGALCLQDRLYSVDGHEKRAECGGAQGCCESLHGHGYPWVGLKDCQRSCVCGGITKTAERSLQDCRWVALIKPPDSALGIESAHGGGHCCTMSVLIVGGGAEPHKRRHLDSHGAHSSEAFFQGLVHLQRGGKIVGEVLPLLHLIHDLLCEHIHEAAHDCTVLQVLQQDAEVIQAIYEEHMMKKKGRWVIPDPEDIEHCEREHEGATYADAGKDFRSCYSRMLNGTRMNLNRFNCVVYFLQLINANVDMFEKLDIFGRGHLLDMNL